MLKLIMVLLWMILLVVLLCAEAENMTEVRGELGTNVTLTCSNQTSDTHWYMEIHSHSTACIGCYSSGSSTYCSPGFETKFSILGNKLVIKNLTAEDCRLYYCDIKKNGSNQFVETFQLVSDLLTNNPQNDNTMSQFSITIILYISVSVALIILVLGGVMIQLCLRRNNRSKQLEDPSAPIYENVVTLHAFQGKAINSQPAKHH
ncbi:CD22 antigen [Sarotherodon galilaeus]